MTYITIIIPFNKGKRYLVDCFESLKEQGVSDKETILIVNGNTEDISDLINEYQDDLNLIVKYFDNELGVSKARNIALDIASGEYVYFMDSDDYLYDKALSNLVKVAEKSNADFINGERVITPFIKQRFNEHLSKENFYPLKKGKLSDIKFSMKLLVGDKTSNKEVLSVLHSLIKRDKINNTRFNENLRYNSDYFFILDIIDNIETFKGVNNALYAKRARDDPVNLTSLNQEEKENSLIFHLKDYKKAIEILNKKSGKKINILKIEMVNKIFKYYYKSFTSKFLNSENDIWREENFNAMCDVSEYFNMLNIGKKQKKEIEALQNRDKKTLKYLLLLKVYFNRIKSILKREWKSDKYFYNKYNKKPIKENKIIFESFRGDYYSDSPKYLYEYLYENYRDDYDFVWVINDENVQIPGNPKTVKRFSKKYYKEVAQSKYWVINGRQAGRLKKRDEQVIVSTWHGTPLKKLGLDMGNVYTEDPNLKKSYINVASKWDYLISPNNYTTNIYKSAFAYDAGEILEYGYPRNDILYNANDSQISEFKEKLNLPQDKKVILYAPTWRDDEFYEVGKVKFQLKLELDKLKEAIGDEYIVLVRTHYFIADNIDLTGCEDFAFDVSRYDDIAELYLASDILITDYSSVFFDFANLKRPILFYTYDLDKYANILRGFYLDVTKDLPGPLLFSTEEVIQNIKSIDLIKEEYAQKYDEFYDKFCSFEDGNASKRIVEKIWNF